MTNEEGKAMDVINEFFSNRDLPMNRIKSVHIQWESIDGYYFPVVKCEFYEKFRSVLHE